MDIKTRAYSNIAADISADAAGAVFTAQADSADAVFVLEYTLSIPFGSYIMLPACAYDGNRFEAVERKYPVMFTESEFGLNPPVRMTQVPRLSKQPGGKLEVTTGDMAVPCVCVFDRQGSGFMLFTRQGVKGLNFGITLTESESSLVISISAPAKRALVYRWYDFKPSLRPNPAADGCLSVKAGEQIKIPASVFTFDCTSIEELYERFFAKRLELYSGSEPACLPFSAFTDMTEEQMNTFFYDKDREYYALSARDGRKESIFEQWQPGWCGGGMNTLALMLTGHELSIKRAINTLKYAAKYQSAAGFYYGIVFNGKVYHDCYGNFEGKYNFALVRKQGDMAYFMFKQLMWLKANSIGNSDDLSILEQSAVKCADALVKLFKRYGQVGQFVNAETGEIIVGGSANGAIVPSALCAAYDYTGNMEYLTAAAELARMLYEGFTSNGLTNGGPGEILQAPDSESAAALTESFVNVYEATGDESMLSAALGAARQLASWVVAYDYEFPPKSRFGILGIQTRGSVWANVQNKHSAPGLCTQSPLCLLKLYRYTGDEGILRLMREIARYQPQSASRPDKPITSIKGVKMRPGEMCERVNMSDWEGNQNVGDSIFGSSPWPQASTLLTGCEVPGIYINESAGVLCVSDHVFAEYKNGELTITNPTKYDARVTVFKDDAQSISRPLGWLPQKLYKTIEVKAGQSMRQPY